MTRPIALFTGQWADLSLDDLAARVASWGYDGLEIACWGDHFEVDRALAEPDYIDRKRKMLEQHNLQVYAISEGCTSCANRTPTSSNTSRMGFQRSAKSW